MKYDSQIESSGLAPVGDVSVLGANEMAVESKREGEPSALAAAWEYVWSLGLMAIIVFSGRSALADWYEVPSGSMLPTIQEGDRIFVNKLAYNLRVPFTTVALADTGELKRGDIVVFLYPRDGKTDYVKRLVGLPGDKIEVRDNVLYINDKAQPRRLARLDELPPGAEVEQGAELYVENLEGVNHFVWERVTEPAFGPVMVNPDSFFVIGDNRDNSSDSRIWGEVPMHFLKGHALSVVFSADPHTDYFILDPRRIRGSRFFSSLGFDGQGP